METPICDFVRAYAERDTLRLHMPGHKGKPLLGMESLDLTEICGADSLYEADGIICESEKNAGALFGARTFYSTEGSSQCIRAMLYLAMLHARSENRRPLILAGRNAHKTFLSAAALLDFDIQWLWPAEGASYLSCKISAAELDAVLSAMPEKPVAVYLTSPDYLGNVVDIKTAAEVCHRHGSLLLVDNAHGAYLKFLPQSCHPVDLGADICCDSAHKTLPVLTGGAYLQIAHSAPDQLARQAKTALAMFGSTSPSYLILQSLDAANRYLADGYREKLAVLAEMVAACKARLSQRGYTFVGDEAIKLTVDAKAYGYDGRALAEELRRKNIECEFADPDFLVLMLTPETGEAGLRRMEEALTAIPRKTARADAAPLLSRPETVMRVREAAFSPVESIAAAESCGRVLAAATVGCPPAVPIVVCGERIDGTAVACFDYYGIESCCVVAE